MSANNPDTQPRKIILECTKGLPEQIVAHLPTYSAARQRLSNRFQTLLTEGRTLFHGLKRDELKHLLIVCTQKSHFQFNGEYFDQTDDLAMGSPLGPLFANIFMPEFEKKHMVELKKLGISFWKRYVDDIFATLNIKGNAKNCLDFLNKQHPNIKFTIEHECNKTLPF
ncbi:unnamed protein product [Brachionus calyciflorus]|uniref:Reverse transcriptase domain-containing protein n=1 Tax=Brachionus calyciflorus TaxID=104777 RepID=A0A814FX80_9BILA|nr:unnamed protein product [Brachionus calyciflorus]